MRWICIWLVGMFCACGTIARGQTTQSTEPVEAAARPTTAPTTAPIALADINAEIDAAIGATRGIGGDLTPEALNPPFAKSLDELKQHLDDRFEETQIAINSQPSMDSLRELGQEWAEAWTSLDTWRKDLNARLAKLDRDVLQLADLQKHWTDRLNQAKASGAPADVIKRIEGLLDTIARSRPVADAGRGQLLGLQSRATEQFNRVNDTLMTINSAKNALVARLAQRDDAPIWKTDFREQSSEVIAASQNSFHNQLTALRRYVDEHADFIIAHLLIAVVIIVALFWVRRRVAKWTHDEPDLRDAFDVFSYPIATGLLAGLILGAWLYPQPPRLMHAILGAAIMAPTIILLRRVLDERFHQLLVGMAAFWAFDQVRAVTASQRILNRWLFLIEMMAAVLFVLWLIRGRQLRTMVGHLHNQIIKWVAIALRVGGVLCLAAFSLNLVGYVGLSKLVGGSTLQCGYVAMILYALGQILDGLITAALRLWPLTLLQMVRRHRDTIHAWAIWLVRWGLLIWWGWITLELFAVRAPLFAWMKRILTATITFGPLQLSMWNVASFVFAAWASFALSRLIRFLLDEDVYPRLQLPRGLPYAISSVLHYTVLLIGFFTAVGALGYDLTKFTILAGAFGVGLGFGLQNIVNNFVSGIILLFERPLQVGDTIEIDGLTGVVRRIGIRASIIRTTTGSELIVPNGRFISEKVTNWTFSSGQRAIGLTIAVASDAEPKQVIESLLQTAGANELITDSPAPQVVMTGFSAGAMTFELQAWTKRYEDWQIARSELAIAVAAALKTAGINVK
jgi:small-conductance mechanosensitive channel